MSDDNSYSQALKRARMELNGWNTSYDHVSREIERLEKELAEAKKKKERALGEISRLGRLVDSLQAAGGVE